jgi:hypothetical protein
LGDFTLDDVDPNNDDAFYDTMSWPEVSPGTYYQFTESVPAGWELHSIVCTYSSTDTVIDAVLDGGNFLIGVSISLSPGDDVHCTFNNEQVQPETGRMEVTKTVDWNGFPPDTEQTFEICITGPSCLNGDCQTTDYDGDMLTWDDLEPGEYTVIETEVGAQWAVTIDSSPVTVEAGSTAQVSVTNTKEKSTAIDLASFTAEAGAGSVTLAWETGTEIDNAGFNLYRALLEDGPYTQINGALIAAEGDAVSGGSYSFVDTSDYGTFYYQLEDVDYYGTSTLHGPVKVTVARPLRRPLYRPTLPEF